jgi:hypothetical protein
MAGATRGVTFTRLLGAAVMVVALGAVFVVDFFRAFSEAGTAVSSVLALALRTPAGVAANAFFGGSAMLVVDALAARARVTRFAGEVGAMLGRRDAVIRVVGVVGCDVRITDYMCIQIHIFKWASRFAILRCR